MRTINLRNVPDDLHREAKIAALKEDKTLTEWMIEAIKEKLERSMKK